MTTKSELDRKREQIRYLRNRISRDQSDIHTRKLALERAVKEYEDLRVTGIPERANNLLITQIRFLYEQPLKMPYYKSAMHTMPRPKNQRTTLLLLREGKYSDAAKHYIPHPLYPILNRLVADASNQQ